MVRRKKQEDVVKLTVTLQSGVEFELGGGRDEAVEFHRRYKKFVDGQIHKTDNHRIVKFNNTYFHASCIAAYNAVDNTGSRIDLGACN